MQIAFVANVLLLQIKLSKIQIWNLMLTDDNLQSDFNHFNMTQQQTEPKHNA